MYVSIYSLHASHPFLLPSLRGSNTFLMSPSALRDLLNLSFHIQKMGTIVTQTLPSGSCEDKKMGSEKAPNVMRYPKVGIQ